MDSPPLDTLSGESLGVGAVGLLESPPQIAAGVDSLDCLSDSGLAHGDGVGDPYRGGSDVQRAQSLVERAETEARDGGANIVAGGGLLGHDEVAEVARGLGRRSVVCFLELRGERCK